MTTITNPFTTGTALSAASTTERFPQSFPYSRDNVPQNVPTSQTVVLVSSDIANVISALTQITSLTTASANPFNISTQQASAMAATLALFNTLSAGSVTFTQTQLQNLVITALNIGALTPTQIVAASGNMLTASVSTRGTNYVAGTYTDVLLTGGSGIQAYANIVVTSLGVITSLTISSPGTSYTPGTYTNVPLTGGTGASATANITVANTTQIATITKTTGGTGYVVGTYSSIPLTGGTGVGATANITVGTSSGVGTLIVSNTGLSYTDGTYSGVPLVGGSGTGAKANLTFSGGSLITLSISAAGSGYTLNDTFTVAAVNVGGTGFDLSMYASALSSTSVTSVTLVDRGTGYVSTVTLGVAAISLGGTGSGFTATITLVNGITDITVVNGGTGFTPADTISASAANIGGTGSGFTATVTTKFGVQSVSITSGGFGYKTGDVLSCLNTDLSSPNGSAFTCTPTSFNTSAVVQAPSSFPQGATTVACNDGYFIVDKSGTGSWFISNNQNGLLWDVLNTASIESRSDYMQAVDQFSGGTVVLFGAKSTEFWSDAGVFPFPYQRITGTQQDWGLAAKWSRAYFQNSIAFLGQNFEGQVQVMVFNGYAPQRISTDDIENIINTFTTVNDAIAYSYVVFGHNMYQITFPSGNRTFVYDGTTQVWHEVQSGINVFNRHLTSLGTTYNFNNYVSDCVNGNMYYLDPTNQTDNGSIIRREIDSMHINLDGNEFGIDEIYIDMDIGNGTQVASIGDDNDPKISMHVSKNNGKGFGPPRVKSIGKVGQFVGPRVVYRRLGSSRDFVIKLVQTSAVPFIITFAAAVIRHGTEK